MDLHKNCLFRRPHLLGNILHGVLLHLSVAPSHIRRTLNRSLHTAHLLDLSHAQNRVQVRSKGEIRGYNQQPRERVAEEG